MKTPLFIFVQSVFGILDLAIFICSVVGNSVVIYVISSDKKLRIKSNYHILSVAVADLTIGLVGIPLGVVAGVTGFPHEFYMCLLLNCFLMSVFAVSMFSLVAVSIDRCWAVCFPVTYHVTSKRNTRWMIAACWVFGTFFGFLPMLGWNSGQTDYRCDLRVVADFNYLLFVCVVIGFMSTLVVIVLYTLIYRAILRQAVKRQDIVANVNESVKQKLEIQAAHTLAMIVGTFIILWTPGMFCIFYMSITNNRGFPLDIIQFTTILVHLNGAIDPIIYAYRMKNMREALQNFFSCFKRKRRIGPANSVTNEASSSRSVSVKTSTSDKV